MKELKNMSQGWMKEKKPLTTDDEKAFGKNYNPAPKAKKNNTIPSVKSTYGSAQKNVLNSDKLRKAKL